MITQTAFSPITLTHVLDERIPLWPGDPPFATRSVATLPRDGYNLRAFGMGEHSGTHANAPAAFLPQGTTAENLPPLFAPAVVFTLEEEARSHPRCRLSPRHVEVWEAAHGRVPAGCIALLHTGWDALWSQPQRYLASWPGFSPQAAELLVARGVAGLGTDTHGLDPCDAGGYPVNTLLATHALWMLECLCHLDRLPPVGAWVTGGALPLRGGTGAPAVLVGLVPPKHLDKKRG